MTDAKILIPAAQYLRMSTEHQQYSLENQAASPLMSSWVLKERAA